MSATIEVKYFNSYLLKKGDLITFDNDIFDLVSYNISSGKV